LALCGLAFLAPAHAATFGTPNDNGIPLTMHGMALRSSGTGFYVAVNGYFVTASHVADGCAALAVLRKDGAHAAILVSLDNARDIAVLKSARVSRVPALMSGAGSQHARPFTITRTRDLAGLPSRETIAARYVGAFQVSNRPSVSFAVRASVAVVGGNSGSPAVTESGAVAGMVSAASTVDPTIALVIDGRDIAEALSAAHAPFKWNEADDKLGVSRPDASEYTFPIACYRAK
jgi:S1-C subfamily serine protease